jgi:hypothetical protein
MSFNCFTNHSLTLNNQHASKLKKNHATSKLKEKLYKYISYTSTNHLIFNSTNRFMGPTLGLTDPIVDLKLDCMKMCRECVYKKLLKTLYSRYIYGSTRLNISYFNLMITPPQTLGECQATKLDQPIQKEHKHDEHTLLCNAYNR